MFEIYNASTHISNNVYSPNIWIRWLPSTKNMTYYPHLDLKFNNNSQRVQGSVIRWLEIQHTSYEIMNGIWSQWYIDYNI